MCRSNIRARAFLLITLHTGMCRGEIIGLMWEDIDFQEKIIHVRHNAIIKEKPTTISDDLKTKAGQSVRGSKNLQHFCNKTAADGLKTRQNTGSAAG